MVLATVLNFFIRPTPEQFLYIIIIYLILAGFWAYLFAGWFIAFMGTIASLQIAVSVYKLIQDNKVRDKQETKNDWFIYCVAPIVLLWFLGVKEGALFRDEFVLDKQALHQITGVVPKTHTRRETGGKTRRTYYYLTIDKINFHCSEDDHDDCDRIYDYQGQTATVYYQPDTKNGNLVYEIIVGDVKVYHFDNQLTDFKNKRHKENIRYLWAFILYVLPTIYFIFAHQAMVEYLDEMDEEEKVRHDLQNELDKIHSEAISAKDYGVIGFVVYWFGLFCVIFALIAFVFIFIKQTLISFVIFLLLAVIARICTYYPYQIAKENHQQRINEKWHELKTQFSQINTSPMPVMQYDINKPYERPTTVNHAVISKSIAQSYSKPTYHEYDEYDDDEYEHELLILADFGWLNFFVLLVGVMTFLVNAWLFFNNNDKIEITILQYAFFLCYAVGSLMMIYKPIANARFNRDIRAGYKEWEDNERPYSFFYWVFRMLALSLLIPLFLWTIYWGFISLINVYWLGILSLFFHMIAVGYGIRKLW